MTLSWEKILREIDRYYAVGDLQWKCKWALNKFLEDWDSLRNASNSKKASLMTAAMGGVAGETALTQDTDLSVDMGIGVAATGVLMVGEDLLVGTIGKLALHEDMQPRPFLFSPGSHSGFETFLMDQIPPSSKKPCNSFRRQPGPFLRVRWSADAGRGRLSGSFRKTPEADRYRTGRIQSMHGRRPSLHGIGLVSPGGGMGSLEGQQDEPFRIRRDRPSDPGLEDDGLEAKKCRS